MEAGVRSVERLVAGQSVFCHPSTQARRLAACDRCPVSLGNWCAPTPEGCGCYLPAKTALAAESCPNQHWSAEP